MTVFRWPDLDSTFNPRQEPRPVPGVGVHDGDVMYIKVNATWWSHVLGALEVLAVRDAWDGSETEIDYAVQQIEILMQPENAMFPIGAIMPYAGETAPPGWLLCDGAVVPVATFPELFAVIGNTYSPFDYGVDYFAIPNLNGRVPAGAIPGGGRKALGEEMGEEYHTLTVDEMPAHTHIETRWERNAGSIAGAAGGVNDMYYQGESGSTGGGQPHNNMQPTLFVNYIIYTGV